MNQCWFRHSARNLPLNDSMNALSVGLPGRLKSSVTLIREIAETRVRYGYRRIHVLLRREGWDVNAKRVYRLYKELGLQLRRKPPKRRVKAKLRPWPACYRVQAAHPDGR